MQKNWNTLCFHPNQYKVSKNTFLDLTRVLSKHENCVKIALLVQLQYCTEISGSYTAGIKMNKNPYYGLFNDKSTSIKKVS